jgi:NADPH:quinone reductase-like Zn-dependent oxidoreductase
MEEEEEDEEKERRRRRRRGRRRRRRSVEGPNSPGVAVRVTPALPRALGADASGTIVAATGCSRSSTSDDVTAASWTI